MSAATMSDLQIAMRNADMLSQTACTRIGALAVLALRGLQVEIDVEYMQNLVHVLKVIREQADELLNDINVEAEGVGCNFIDDEDREQSAKFFRAFSHSVPKRGAAS